MLRSFRGRPRRLVDNRHGAIAGIIAGIFSDGSRDDIDDGRTITVAVPGNDTVWLNHKFAKTQHPVGDLGRLLRKIDRSEDRVGDTFRRRRVGFCRVGAYFVSRTLARTGHIGEERNRAGDDSRDKKDFLLVHRLFPIHAPRHHNWGGPHGRIGEIGDEIKYRMAFKSIASRYLAASLLLPDGDCIVFGRKQKIPASGARGIIAAFHQNVAFRNCLRHIGEPPV
jgi:hypothetical protein